MPDKFFEIEVSRSIEGREYIVINIPNEELPEPSEHAFERAKNAALAYVKAAEDAGQPLDWKREDGTRSREFIARQFDPIPF